MPEVVLSQARVWLFDFDNTLAGLEATVNWTQSRIALEAYLREVGIDGSIFEEFPRGNLLMYEALRGRLLDGAGKKLAEPALTDGKREISSDRAAISRNAVAVIRRASQIIEGYELAGVAQAQALPGAIELLNEMARARHTVGIVTSNSSRTVIRWLERHNLVAKIAVVIGRDSELALKPSPAMLLSALARTGAHAADAIFVGDSEADFRAAMDAGVGFVGIAGTSAGRARLINLGAALIFKSPAALMHSLHIGEPAR